MHPLLCETGLILSSIVLDNRQRLYAYWLLSLPDNHLAKKILPVSLRMRDAALDKLLEDNLIWTKNTQLSLYAQWLAWQLMVDYPIDPVDGVELIEKINPELWFQGNIMVKYRKHLLKEARKFRSSLVI